MICIVASNGGHFKEVKLAIQFLAEYPKFYITNYLPNMKIAKEGEEVFYVINPHDSIIKYIINFFQSLFIVLKKRPEIIITSGAGIVLSACLVGILLGAKIFFIESGSRILYPSRTGRLLYKISNLFIIQSQKLKKYYPKAFMIKAL